jgi:hypothetical protein
MQARTILGGLLLFLCSPSCMAAESAGPSTVLHVSAARWSMEARLRLRFDPAHIQERERLASAVRSGRPTRMEAEETENRSFRVSVDGKTHPELLLPHEVFNGLLTVMQPDPELRALQRALLAPRLVNRGMDPELFWEELSRIAAPFVTARYGKAPFAEVCRARNAALTAARAHFGAEAFDELLYAVVAPSVRLSVAASSADEARSRLLRDASCR